MVYEMQVDHTLLRLDGRMFEVLSFESDFMMRLHVDVAGFAVKGPDGKGRYKVQIGTLRDGELYQAMTRTSLTLDEAQFQRFSRLVELSHAARDAGPDPW